MHATVERVPSTTYTYLVCALAWVVPGGGHLLLGRRQKGMLFLIMLTAMFSCGLWLEGRLFPFEFSQPLVALAAFADLGMGIPYVIAKLFDMGAGRVVAMTYEYGNAFLIVAGLMNLLVVLDAFDVLQGAEVTTHLGLMVLFAFFVSTVFALLMRDHPREQTRFGVRLFAAFVVGGVLLGWLLYPLPL